MIPALRHIILEELGTWTTYATQAQLRDQLDRLAFKARLYCSEVLALDPEDQPELSMVAELCVSEIRSWDRSDTEEMRSARVNGMCERLMEYHRVYAAKPARDDIRPGLPGSSVAWND